MLLLEEGFLIYGTVLSVIRVLPGGLCHFLQPPPHPGVLRTQEEDRKPLWINDIPQLCVLGRLFNSFHVMTRQSCGGNEVVLAGGMWVWKAMGGQRQKVLKDKTARSVPKSRNGGEALQSGLLHSWALGQQKQHPRKKMQCSGTFVSSA